MKIYDCNHIPIETKEVVGTGGEATVYSLKKKNNVLCKAYHKNNNHSDVKNKIEVMIKHKTFQKLQSHPNYSLPIIEIFDENKQWIGYAKRNAEGVNLSLLAHPILMKKNFPKIKKVDIVETLIKFLKDVQRLHENEIFIGDYNLSNFLINKKTYDISFIDTDSWQFTYRKKIYRCNVGTADMTPPEHQSVDFKTINRTIESELFSIAVLLFKVLMQGRHPYDQVGGESVLKNISNGLFPYNLEKTTNKYIPNGPWFNLWNELSKEIKVLFMKTFCNQSQKRLLLSSNSQKRATVEEWISALSDFRYTFLKGKNTKVNSTQPQRLDLMKMKNKKNINSSISTNENIEVDSNLNQPTKSTTGRLVFAPTEPKKRGRPRKIQCQFN